MLHDKRSILSFLGQYYCVGQVSLLTLPFIIGYFAIPYLPSRLHIHSNLCERRCERCILHNILLKIKWLSGREGVKLTTGRFV